MISYDIHMPSDKGTSITVYQHRAFVWFIGLIALIFALSPASAQTEVIVHQPVDGLFVRGTNVRLFEEESGIVDTHEGVWSVIQIPLLSLNPRPLWSPNGQSIAFRFVGKYAGVVNPSDNMITFSTEWVESTLNVPFDITYVRGWSADGRSLTIDYGLAEINVPNYLANIDLENKTSQQIREWQTDDPVTDMPLPPDATSVQLSGGARIERNPVFDDWFMIQFGGSGTYSSFDIGEPLEIDINVLWNFRTDEYISLDALVPDLWISTYPGDWSHDGKRWLFYAISKDLRDIYIVTFDFTLEQGLTLAGQAIVDNRTPQHWLDAGSLFFSIIQDYQNGATYVLGEIVNGEYRETPFFTLNGDLFRRESIGDWYMRADEAERNHLSCLFEWSLPPRFSLGDRARVNFTDGSPLLLREAPDLNATQITQLTEGTAFAVIGGPACVNTGDDHYRFWQIELDDGRSGWAAEANMTDYFMEPLADVSTVPSSPGGQDISGTAESYASL